MVDIAVIGAGAAGLVTTRHLLRCGLKPCVFESARSPGGSWAAGQKMWDNLTPNLSRYTCSFSDFPWEAPTPTYPSRQDMQSYFERYAASKLENGEDCFRYGCTVTQVKRSSTKSSSYNVEWVQQDGEKCSRDFDGVVVATGFFNKPIMPAGLDSFVSENEPRVLHSSTYKSPEDFVNQTVAVIGSSFSAHEISADVRKKAKHVINILPTIPWVLPRYVPYANTFLPLDLVLYQRNADAPAVPASIAIDKDACHKRYTYLRDLLGVRKQSVIGIPKDDGTPPMVSISDDYLNLVTNGKVEVVHGRFAKAVSTGDSLTVELEDGTALPDIDRIIACTGYQSQLDFLEPQILQTLQYNPSDGFCPLTLCYDAFHPKLPSLGFVGMYKGVYMGGMELQARLVAGWLSDQMDPSEASMQEALAASETIRQYKPRAQFPRFDYIGMMDTMAEQLDIVPSSKQYRAKGSFVVPAFYQQPNEISQKVQEELKEEVRKAIDEGATIPRAAMSALVGKWTFDRQIRQMSGTAPPQYVSGEIDFSLQGEDWETLLYREDGVFELPNGQKLEVFREYEYIQKHDTLEIYFVEEGKRAHMFLSLKFQKEENGYWVATSDHLCIKDLYKGTFKIKFDGIGASEVSMTYRVKGPNKDYESITLLQPKE